jgi:GNAT superfamily N-acetyltransferase
VDAPEVTLEPASVADAEALADLRALAMRKSLERVGRFDAQRVRERLLAEFSAAHTQHICSGGRRVGFVVLRPHGDGLLLDHLYVTPDAQGGGIGAAVLAQVFALADREWKTVRVGALKQSDANRFYLRHGFALVEVAEWDNYYVRAPRILGRVLARDEIARVWEIDRSETIERVYHLVHGALTLTNQHIEVKGWPPGEAEIYKPILERCADLGGWLFALFDGAALIAMVAIDNRWLGSRGDQLQLEFLHVGRSYRGQGIGQRLFRRAAEVARGRGAQRLYITATSSEHTIDFYRRLGCRLASELDPELLALEPEDIHLECDLISSNAAWSEMGGRR